MRTRVVLNRDETEGPVFRLFKGDICFVDGYVTAADNKPYAVCIRESDGKFGFMDIFSLTAMLEQRSESE